MSPSLFDDSSVMMLIIPALFTFAVSFRCSNIVFYLEKKSLIVNCFFLSFSRS